MTMSSSLMQNQKYKGTKECLALSYPLLGELKMASFFFSPYSLIVGFSLPLLCLRKRLYLDH